MIAHLLQQTRRVERTSKTVQRAATDFQIRGKEVESSAFPNMLFFDRGSSTLDAAEKAKISALAAPPGRALTLNGFTSEEGSSASNLAITTARIAAVDAELVAAGHTGARTPAPQPTASAGRIEYRRMRAVEVVPTGIPSSVPSCAAGSVVPCGPAPNSFTTGQTEAVRLLDNAITALGSAPLPAATAALVARFFGGAGAAGAVRANLIFLRHHIDAEMTPENAAGPGHRCANLCDASCAASEAYNTGVGASALMTLCPSYTSQPSLTERARILIHEGAHGTTGLATDDLAYAHQRLITFLSPADALRNTDSYVLLVMLINAPGSVAVGPAAPDLLTGAMTVGEQRAAQRTVAWLEKWLTSAYQEMASLYSTVHDSIPGGSWTNAYYRDSMGFVAPRFGLTRPPAVPTVADKVKLAAIHDRYLTMRTALRRPVTITKIAAGSTSWVAGPGSSVNVTPAFFALGPGPQLNRLLTAIVHATPDISAPLESHYVRLVDEIRNHQGIGSP